MKTSLTWLKAIVAFCLIALVSSCNDLTRENELVPEPNRAELEAIAKQYGLKLSPTDPNAKNIIRVSSVEEFRQTVAKHYRPVDEGRQTRWDTFARGLLNYRLGSNYSSAAHLRFNKWNANRVSWLLKRDVTGQHGHDANLGWPWPRRDRGTRCPTFPERGCDDDEGPPEETPEPPKPVSPYEPPTGDPTYTPTTPPYTGPTDPTYGGPGDYPGGPIPGDSYWSIGDEEATVGEPARFTLGDCTGTLLSGTPGGKAIKTSITIFPGTLPGDIDAVYANLQIYYDFKKVNGKIVGVQVTVSAPGDLGRQVFRIDDEGYQSPDGDGSFFVLLVMNYQWTGTGIGIGTVNVTPTAQSADIMVSFYVDKYGRPIKFGKRKI
jgi:hypothetical protein